MHLKLVLNPILSQVSGNLTDELITDMIAKVREFLDHVETGSEYGERD